MGRFHAVLAAGLLLFACKSPLFDNQAIEDEVAKRTEEHYLRVRGKPPLTMDELSRRIQTRASIDYPNVPLRDLPEDVQRKLSDIVRGEYLSTVLTPAEGAELQSKKTQANDQFRDFAGVKFGVGPSLRFGGRAEVESAEVVDNVVRVTKESKAEPLLLLEVHKFFTPQRKLLGAAPGSWGLGPFLGIHAGNDEVINSFAMGVMIGFRYDDEPGKGTNSKSFNIGIGAVYDRDVKILGDGIVEGQPLPGGETVIRFKEVGDWGAVVTFSFSFGF